MPSEIEISEQDVYRAMKDIEGYIDISMSDFRELYIHAVRHAKERLLTSTLIGQIMTSDVISVEEQTSIENVFAAMAAGSVSGLPVLGREKNVVGVISEKDIFNQFGGGEAMSFWSVLSNCLHDNKCLLKTIACLKTADIMTSPAITVQESESAQRVVQLFAEKKINRLPVIDDSGSLVGIVTRTDLLQAHLQDEEI